MDIQFNAEITDFRTIHGVLKAITFKEFAIFRPLKEGLKITIEEMRSTETSAYIPTDMFTTYYVDESEDVRFKLSLKIFTECLNIYGDHGNPCLKMSYKSSGSPLSIVLRHSEQDITIDCEIQTLQVEDSADLNLGSECSLNKILVNAKQFAEVLSDLDNTSDDLELSLSPNPPLFRITTTSVMGESQIDISKDSEMVLLFQCDREFISRYAFSDIHKILKVMSYANKVSISTGTSGLVGLQFSINVDSKQMYVEYYVTALFED